MLTQNIQYSFALPDGNRSSFSVDVRHGDATPASRPCEPEIQWVQLGFHQCPNCPLVEDKSPCCPLAVSIHDIIEFASELVSHHEVRMEVKNGPRTIQMQTTVQDGLSSLMGLVIATSGCPHTLFLKPMALMHLPQSTPEETSYRAITMYLLAQYYVAARRGTPDLKLEGLKKIYSNLHLVNEHIAKRMKKVVKQDGSLNALMILDAFTANVPLHIDDALKDLKDAFHMYLKPLKL